MNTAIFRITQGGGLENYRKGRRGEEGWGKMGTEGEELISSEFVLQLELSVLCRHASIILLKLLFHLFPRSSMI